MRKAVPIVLRTGVSGFEFLGFEHPLAGRQIVKGGIEAGESNLAAAKRELLEESGLTLNAVFTRLGSSFDIAEGQEWMFFEAQVDGLPDAWDFETKDDGGHLFRFFWQGLDGGLDRQWHPVFHRAIGFVRRAVRGDQAPYGP